MKMKKLMWSGAFLAAMPLAAQTTQVDEEAARMVCGTCAGFALAVPLVLLAINIIVAVWIYKDATRRGNPQAAVWAILGFFFSLIGLAIYIGVRNSQSNVVPPPPPPPVV